MYMLYSLKSIVSQLVQLLHLFLVQLKADSTFHLALQFNLCRILNLGHWLRLAGAVFIALKFSVHMLRLIDNEFGWVLFEHRDAGRTLELLGRHGTTAPQDLLLVLTHDQETYSIGHNSRTTAQRLCEKNEHILRIGNLIVWQHNCKGICTNKQKISKSLKYKINRQKLAKWLHVIRIFLFHLV